MAHAFDDIGSRSFDLALAIFFLQPLNLPINLGLVAL
jgi:hypothetical protein